MHCDGFDGLIVLRVVVCFMPFFPTALCKSHVFIFLKDKIPITVRRVNMPAKQAG